MLERPRSRCAAAAVVVALALCGCTAPWSAPETPAVREASAAVAANASLPTGVPLVAGSVTVVKADLIGEFSRFPQARWVVRVLGQPVLHSSVALENAQRTLVDAGYQVIGRSDNSPTTPAELWMARAGTTVLVQTSAEMPWLLDYTVTRSFTECARSYCD